MSAYGRYAHTRYGTGPRRWRPLPERRRRRLPILLVTLLFVTGGGGVVFGWRARTIEITGTTMTPPAVVRDAALVALGGRRWGIIPRASILLGGSRHLANALQRQFAFATVDIHTDRHGAMRIAVTEQPTVGIVRFSGKGSARIGANGAVIGTVSSDVPELADPAQVLVFELVGDLPPVGSVLLAAKHLQSLRSLWEELLRAGGPLTPAVVTPKYALGEDFDLRTTSGAVFAVSADAPERQLEKLRAVLRDRGTPVERAELRSVDLRYGDRVYVQ